MSNKTIYLDTSDIKKIKQNSQALDVIKNYLEKNNYYLSISPIHIAEWSNGGTERAIEDIAFLIFNFKK